MATRISRPDVPHTGVEALRGRTRIDAAPHRLEPWEGQDGTESFKDGTAGNEVGRHGGGYFFLGVSDPGSTCDVPRRRRKGSLRTTPRIREEKRLPDLRVDSVILSMAGPS